MRRTCPSLQKLQNLNECLKLDQGVLWEKIPKSWKSRGCPLLGNPLKNFKIPLYALGRPQWIRHFPRRTPASPFALPPLSSSLSPLRLYITTASLFLLPLLPCDPLSLRHRSCLMTKLHQKNSGGVSAIRESLNFSFKKSICPSVQLNSSIC